MPSSPTFSLIVYTAVLIPLEAVGLFLFRRRGIRGGTPWMDAVGLCALLTLLALSAAIIGAGPAGAARLFGTFMFVHLPLVMLVAAGMCAVARYVGPAVVGALGAVALAAVGVDAFLVEPTWLQVSRVEIPTAKVDRPLRIVVLADLQTDSIGPYERRVIEAAAAQDPDLVLFLGDYLQSPVRPIGELESEFQRIWKESGLDPPLGTYALQGNVDGAHWDAIFDGLPIEIVSRTEDIEVGPIRLTCLGMHDSFNPGLRLRSEEDPESFRLVAGHSPDYMLGDTPGDLLLSGHTHGGQVQIPFFGPILTLASVPRRWSAGILSRRDDGAWIRVSRGTGMERGDAPRLRFWCRPEIVVIDLVPQPGR